MLRYRAGRSTAALSLIVLGLALLLDNFQGSNYFNLVLRLWPLLLVGIGVEYLVAGLLAERKGAVRPALAWGSVILVIVLGVVIGLGQRLAVNVGDLPQIYWRLGSHVAWGERSEQVSAVGLQTVQIDLNLGNTYVVPSTDGQVHVHARYTMTADSQVAANQLATDPGHFSLSMNPSGDTLRISPEWLGTERGKADLTVEIPQGLSLTVNSGLGNIQVQNRDSKITLHGSVGEIRVDGGKGELIATTGAGALWLTHFAGPTHLTTSTGALHVDTLQGDLTANTSTGLIDVRNMGAGKVDANAATGSVSVHYAQPPTDDARLISHTGHVQLDLPPNGDVRVSATANTGSVGGPTWLKVERHTTGASANGILGNGTHLMNLHTDLGGINVTD